MTGGTSRGGAGYDYLTVKYSSAGAALWTNFYNGNSYDDRPQAVAVDPNGNALVTGYSRTNNSNASSDYLTIAYSSAGVALWTNRYNGSANDEDVVVAVATDTSGNVFVTGYSGTGTARDYVTIKYSAVGVPLWTNRFNGPADGFDEPAALATCW